MKSKLFLTYPAIFTFEDNQYWVDFIDLKGCNGKFERSNGLIFRRFNRISRMYH